MSPQCNESVQALVFYVNGRKIYERNPDPDQTLLNYLRKNLRLTGAKLGCGEGGCGACTVMLSRFDRRRQLITHYTVNACLAPLVSIHGCAVITVEGVGSTRTKLHPVQARLAEYHGSQCGFCTPGIVMTMYTFFRNNPNPDPEDVRTVLAGNLCRCTGYRSIIAAYQSLAREWSCVSGELDRLKEKKKNGMLYRLRTPDKEWQCPLGKSCCKNRPNSDITKKSNTENIKVRKESLCNLHSTQEPIFPPELLISDRYETSSLVFKGTRTTWYRPVYLQELLDFKAELPHASLVVGNTEIGINMELKDRRHVDIIAATHVRQLYDIQRLETGLRIGGSVSLAYLEETLKKAVDNMPESQTRVFAAFGKMLRLFAGPQIKNVASIAGNVVTASPISDLNPMLQAAGSSVNLMSKDSQRLVKIDGHFFLGYRKTILRPEEILYSIEIPYSNQNMYFESYKQSQREDDDIAIVNAGMNVQFEDGSNVVKDIKLSFGGMAKTTVLAQKTMRSLIARRWDCDLLALGTECLSQELTLVSGTPGGQEAYRNTLVLSFFFKFYHSVYQQLHKTGVIHENISDHCLAATSDIQHPQFKGSQYFEKVKSATAYDDVGKPVVHESGVKHATGEAVYVDDMPSISGELTIALVTSTKAHARIVSVDASSALSLPGVLAYLSQKDIPGSNTPDCFVGEVFATDMVNYYGQIIGAIVAETKQQAQAGAKAVKVNYREMTPVITIEQAIAKHQYHRESISRVTGDPDNAFLKSDHVIEGETRTGGQQHFYMETQVTLAVPTGEDGEMDVFCSTQVPADVQTCVGDVLGISRNKVNVRVKRLGGGFGGKLADAGYVAMPVVIAANRFNCPVRCSLDRNEDFRITGARHPYIGKYKIGFTNDGDIMAADIEFYSNCGYTADSSESIMVVSYMKFTNGYNVPNVRVTTHLCKTNIRSSCAFRGYGGPEAMFVTETWITHIAETLNVPPEAVQKVNKLLSEMDIIFRGFQVRERNLLKTGMVTHFGQVLEDFTLPQCWQSIREKCGFDKRTLEVQLFNREHRWKKRGITLLPTSFPIGFEAPASWNQAGALVSIYTDGSVLIHHGGVEMGQGLHTKLRQIASRVLDISRSKVYIKETSTSCVPNAIPTCASVSSDFWGTAVKNACEKLKTRIQPYKEKQPASQWETWVMSAYEDRVSLSATGFYKYDVSFDLETMRGSPFRFYTVGAACSEVEIDCLTGNHVVLRTDIVMDVGRSLNPAVDIGQIEGGFMQGYGLFMLEEERYSPEGVLLTQGPSTYKIPSTSNTPAEFNVTLLSGERQKAGIYSSKGIGEPPLFLSASVFFATRSAVQAAREDAGIQGFFAFDAPASPERTRMACGDSLAQHASQNLHKGNNNRKPWYVRV